MASTSTNKQPLLVDRPFHQVTTIIGQKTGNAGYWLSNNSCTVLIDCTQNDGALIEDLYVLPRDGEAVNISFFMSNNVDVLREADTSNVVFLGRIDVAGGSANTMQHLDEMPFGIAPYPTVPLATGNSREAGQFKSLYVPRGKAIWVGRAVVSTAPNLDVTTGPVVGAQGGYY